MHGHSDIVTIAQYVLQYSSNNMDTHWIGVQNRNLIMRALEDACRGALYVHLQMVAICTSQSSPLTWWWHMCIHTVCSSAEDCLGLHE